MAPRKEIRARRPVTAAEKERAKQAAARADVVRRRRRMAWMGLVGLAVLGVVMLGAFPVRNYLAQETSTEQAEAELRSLNDEIAGLNDEIDRLSTDEEIERRAREDYNLVRPGEEPFALLPEAPEPVPVPEGWPYDRLFAATR